MELPVPPILTDAANGAAQDSVWRGTPRWQRGFVFRFLF